MERDNKGKFLKEKHASVSTEFKKGMHPSNGFKKGQGAWNKGMKGYNKGHQVSKDTRDKIRIGNSGERNHFWKGGISPLMWRIRHCSKYFEWRSSVFERDNFICQYCEKRSRKLNAHHIEELSFLVKNLNITSFEQAINCEELWNINNGVTLCEECHGKTKGFRRNKI